LLGALISAVGALLSSQQQTRFEHDLRIKSDEISALNKQIVNLVTGGDSYSYFQFSGTKHKPLVLAHRGEHPLYDVKCRLIILGDYTKLPSLSPMAYLSQNEKRLEIGALRSGAWGLQPDIVLSDEPTQGFNIFFEARNGTWVQMVRIRKVGDGYQWSTKVIKRINDVDQVLYEHRSEEFPLNDKGEVDWYQPV
jgi:hypothetical protein